MVSSGVVVVVKVGGGGMFVMSIFSLYRSHSFGTSYWSQTLKGSVDV